MNRLEYKYLVPNDRLDELRSAIMPYVQLDQYALDRQAREYTIRSVYFDTPAMTCYYEKLDGVRIRKKYRIRSYNEVAESDTVFLEIKRKYRNYIDKNRAPVLCRDIERLFASRDVERYVQPTAGNGRNCDDARRFLYHYYRQRLTPRVLVVYEREAFFGKFNRALRITFDKNLRAAPFSCHDCLSNDYPLTYGLPRHFILEVKFTDALPAWMIRTITQMSLPRLALSKYTICLDALGGVEHSQGQAAPLSFRVQYTSN